MIIIRKVTENGIPCKTEACLYKKEGSEQINLYIANYFLCDDNKGNVVKQFKDKYLSCDAVSFRIETFVELMGYLDPLFRHYLIKKV